MAFRPRSNTLDRLMKIFCEKKTDAKGSAFNKFSKMPLGDKGALPIKTPPKIIRRSGNRYKTRLLVAGKYQAVGGSVHIARITFVGAEPLTERATQYTEYTRVTTGIGDGGHRYRDL